MCGAALVQRDFSKGYAMKQNKQDFALEYSEASFWHKMIGFAKVAGKQTIEKALLLYYAAQNPQTPKWAKRVIYGALGYFILPFDAIPDLVPAAGYVDDVGVLVAAIAVVSMYINAEVRAKAAEKMQKWFGALAG